MIIDATNLIAGRLASFVAKHALLGESIDIVNSELAVITGERKVILDKFKHRLERGMPKTGPFVYRQEHRFLKRVIRGMMPYKRPRGKEGMQRITCHIGIPNDLNGKKFETVEQANVAKIQSLKYLTIKEICFHLGRK